MSNEELKTEIKTIMDCHECHNQFVALLDFGIEGNHIVECPVCGHEHCRVIEKGKITEERWSSRYGSDKNKDGIKARRVWKDTVLPMKTSAVSEFLRERWIEKFKS